MRPDCAQSIRRSRSVVIGSDVSLRGPYTEAKPAPAQPDNAVAGGRAAIVARLATGGCVACYRGVVRWTRSGGSRRRHRFQRRGTGLHCVHVRCREIHRCVARRALAARVAGAAGERERRRRIVRRSAAVVPRPPHAVRRLRRFAETVARGPWRRHRNCLCAGRYRTPQGGDRCLDRTAARASSPATTAGFRWRAPACWWSPSTARACAAAPRSRIAAQRSASCSGAS